MLFAAIGGVHGNAAALDAALARIDEMGIHTVVCTGNLAAGGDDGDAVIGALRARGVTCVQGELDRLVVRAARKADSLKKRLAVGVFDAVQRAHGALASGNVEFLRALPHRLMLSFEGKSVCLCHGTVASQSDTLAENDSIERFRRQREAANCTIVICGSDERAFARVVDGTLFVNPGRVDAPGAVATFVVVDTDTDPPSADVVRVA